MNIGHCLPCAPGSQLCTPIDAVLVRNPTSISGIGKSAHHRDASLESSGDYSLHLQPPERDP